MKLSVPETAASVTATNCCYRYYWHVANAVSAICSVRTVCIIAVLVIGDDGRAYGQQRRKRRMWAEHPRVKTRRSAKHRQGGDQKVCGEQGVGIGAVIEQSASRNAETLPVVVEIAVVDMCIAVVGECNFVAQVIVMVRVFQRKRESMRKWKPLSLMMWMWMWMWITMTMTMLMTTTGRQEAVAPI